MTMSPFSDDHTENAASANELIQLDGVIEHVIYHNDENGYSVCELSVNDDELVTVVGTLPFIAAGETVSALGKWSVHPNFGRQFVIESYEKQLPNSETSILRYLSSRAVKGIGPATAAKIVERFGEDSFDVIENHPDWLAEINGVNRKKAEEISEDFKRQFGVRSVMMFCRDFFGPATAVRVYKRWGGSAVDVIKENPYALCNEIYGVGFERADRIAASLGIKEDSPFRIKAAIKYLLSYNASRNGHCYLPKNKLFELASQMLSISSEQTETAIEALCSAGGVKSVKRGSASDIYLKSYYDAELYTAQKLDLLDRVCPKLDMTDVERYIQLIELENGITYAAMQKKAIICALNSGVMVLTGGPGTGKTTVIRAVISVFDRLDTDIALAAPTGRAAKRMSEATSREARTIHRLLEMEFSEGDEPRFNRDENNPLDESVVIIDETSMIDISLMAALLKAMKPGSRLILIGDSDQLPSVGAGNVLHDIIASERFNTVTLREIFRQAGESMIVTNAHAINIGELPNLDKKEGDFFFLSRANDRDIAKTVADLYLYRLPKTYGESIRSGIQVITPSRKGEPGTVMLNTLLQSALNPPSPKKREKKLRDIVFREGDRVMQIKNNYDIEWHKQDTDGVGVFNGDIGVILSIDAEHETMTVSFDERVAEYGFPQLDELELAYAITVHKSQGSEYPCVIIPMYDFPPQLMTRNLLYTAVTRAQKMVVMVGKKEIVQQMVANNRRTKRYSGLADLLRSLDSGEQPSDGDTSEAAEGNDVEQYDEEPD